MVKEKKRLIVIDSNSIIHRAFHALPPLTTKKGKLINAIYGFLLVFFKAIREFQPDYICACFDFPGPTFRHKKFKEYKAKRPPAPKELYNQIPKVKEVLKAFGVSVFEKQGFEADDLIGTISKLAPRKQRFPEIETIILSGDMDTLQLINPQTKVFALKRGVKDTVLYDKTQVRERYGIEPKQILDFKALRGDPSDNIPGVTGIGEKTATMLLNKFKNLENLYKELQADSDKAKELKPKLKELLLKYKEQAFFSKALATIKKDVPIDFNLEKCSWAKYNKKEALKTLKELEFNRLIERLPELDRKSKRNQNKQERSIRKNLRLW